MEKQNVVYTMDYYSSIKRNIVFIHITTRINLENISLNGESQTENDNIVWLYLHEVHTVVIRRDKKNSGYWDLDRERNEELLLNRYRVSVWDDENVGRNSGDNCTKPSVYSKPLNWTPADD